ncbi:MAG: sensor histidine kinase, partial [Bacteroidetes bacterium]|nr:sensor histidine kinase [Bacteroidota bacterium]
KMKILYRLLLLYFALFTGSASFSQSKKIDSLQQVIRTGDTKQRIDALNKLCNEIMYDKPEEGKRYATQAIKTADSIDYELGLADAYNMLGVVYDISGKYDSSIYYYEKAIPIFNKIQNLKGRGSAVNNLGLIYWNIGEFDKALSFFFKALEDFEKIGNDRFASNALNNIGLVYFDIKNYRQSLTYHFKAKKIYEKLQDDYLLGAVSTNIANDYSCLHINDSAEFFYKNAITLHTKAKDDYGLSIAYNGYAGQLAKQGDTINALGYFRRTLTLKESMNELVGVSSILIQMSNIYHAQKNKILELECLEKAKKVAEENNFKKDLYEIYRGLSRFYEETDTRLAFDYFKKYSLYKDSVFNETSNKQITELNTKYETGKKELLLKQQDLQLARKNSLIIAITGLLLLLAIGGFYFYKRNQHRQERKLQDAVIKQQDLATRSVIVAEENERKRIAADLHDGVGQMMSAAKMNLSVFESELSFENENQRTAFENVISLVDESCREIRNVSHQMMPNALLKSGLASAVKEFIDKIDSRVIKVSLHTEGLNERIDSNTETVLYRVIQECVNNVLKHSGASQLDIALIKDTDGIAVTIEDNGKGFNSSDKMKFEGIGLKNIVSRITYLKGTIDFDSSPGNGTLVAIHVPVS